MFLSSKMTFIDVWHPIFKVHNSRQNKYAIVPAQEKILNRNISKEKQFDCWHKNCP